MIMISGSETEMDDEVLKLLGSPALIVAGLSGFTFFPEKYALVRGAIT
jgi:hypothetical protein